MKVTGVLILYIGYILLGWIVGYFLCYYVTSPDATYIIGVIWSALIIATSSPILQMVKKMYQWDFVKTDTTRVMEAVCTEFNVTFDQLKSRSREHYLVDARSVYSYILRTKFKVTLHRIGMELNRDHGTVINHIRRIEDLLSINDPIGAKIGRIEKQLF